VTDFQVTRIIRSDTGSTSFDNVVAGPPADRSVILLPALACLAAPPDPEPGDEMKVHLSAEQTDWLYRTWQAVEHRSAAAIEGLVAKAGGIDQVQTLMLSRFGIRLPRLAGWNEVRCTAAQVAQVYAVLEHLAQAGLRIPRIVREFSDRTHHDTAGRLARVWADITCQSVTSVQATLAAGAGEGQIFADLVLTAPRVGLVVSTRSPLADGIAERYQALTERADRKTMINDLATPLLATGIRLATRSTHQPS